MPISRAISASRWSRARDLTVRDSRVFLKTLERPAAGRRDPAPPRRRLLRSAGAARRFVPRRARAGRSRARRQRRRGQRARQRRWSRRRRCWRSCPRCAGTCSARNCAAIGATTGGAARARSCNTSSSTSTSWSSSRRSRRRAATRLRRHAERRAARTVLEPHPGAAGRVRRAGASRALDRAGAGRRQGSQPRQLVLRAYVAADAATRFA